MQPKTTFLQNVKQPTTAKPSSELERLWQRIDKHTKRNANFDIKKSTLFNQFQEQVEPHEHHQASMIAEQIIHLSKFIPRKSLTAEQRNELVDWINEDLSYLAGHPFIGEVEVEKVTQIFQSHLNKHNHDTVNAIDSSQLNLLRTMLQQDFPGLELTDEDLREVAVDPQKLYKHLDEQGFGEDGNEQSDNGACDANEEHADQDENWDDFFDQFDQFDRDEIKQQKTDAKLEKLFKSSQLNKMYKRLASKLHPDKEPDPTKKAEKHELMQLLGHARKAKDGFTLLQLYITHFDDDVDFDEETRANLVPLLQNKIVELNKQHRQQKEGNDPHSLVWRKFNGRSKAQTKANFANHIAALNNECDEIAERLGYCTTIKLLKEELNDRILDKRHMPISIENALESMFNL
ncbi:J domain-containing protein [Pseudoalteromonas arctica]|uniref:J domain-containing protein n=1 Tax=Pseudoalteromonas arctica TaxID=394751 RepID=A0A7Y0HB09_9GAMM|nr:J domain-containing protein [Pseudoalteromonas arctica]NMM39878.1 J domain-containing protein [Pseudoalteromonas arctica]